MGSQHLLDNLSFDEPVIGQPREMELAMKTIFSVSVLILALSLTSGTTFAQSSEEGLANFYSDSFQGKKMANGEPYDKNNLTASHKKHPFGTKLKVTNIDSGKSVVVTVTDRMTQKIPPSSMLRGALRKSWVSSRQARPRSSSKPRNRDRRD